MLAFDFGYYFGTQAPLISRITFCYKNCSETFSSSQHKNNVIHSTKRSVGIFVSLVGWQYYVRINTRPYKMLTLATVLFNIVTLHVWVIFLSDTFSWL